MYVFATAGEDITPLYQFFNGGSTDHYYSLSPIAPKDGYTLETHQGFIFATSGQDRTPLYQFTQLKEEEGDWLSDIGDTFSE